MLTSVPAESGFYVLDINLLVPTPDNPRRVIDVADEGFRGLMASIKKQGVLQPLVARPHPVLAGMLDLRAGHRRHQAALELGMSSVPVSVHVGMSEREAMEATVTENLDRLNLSALEEARGIERLLSVGLSIDEIADDFGKPVKWVRRRAQLNKLIPMWREFGELLNVKAPALELIARYPVDQQDELLETFEVAKAIEVWREKGQVWYEVEDFVKKGGVVELRTMLARESRDLVEAMWDLDDAELFPEAGACSKCMLRTSAEPLLFDAEELEPQGYARDGRRKESVADFCLRPNCYKAKLGAHCERKFAELQEVGDVVRLSQEYHPKERGVYGSESWQEVKEGVDGAVRGVVTHGGYAVGNVLWVKLRGKAPAAVGKDAGTGKVEKPEVDLVAKREGLDKKRWGWICDLLVKRLEDPALELPAPPAYKLESGLLCLAAVFGMRGKWQPRPERDLRPMKYHEIVELLTDVSGDSVEAEVEQAARLATEAEWKQVLEILDDDDLSEMDDEDEKMRAEELLVRWTAYYQARAEAGDFDAERESAVVRNLSCWDRVASMRDEGIQKIVVWREVAAQMRDGLYYPAGVGSISERHKQHCEMVSELLGLDIHELKQEAAVACPEPASWTKHLKPDVVEVVEECLPEAQGKPKDVKVVAAKKAVRKKGATL